MTEWVTLNQQVTCTLDAAGAGTASIGPDQGPPYWHVDSLVLLSSRPGAAPVPRATVWVDQALQGLTYDASFNAAACNLDLQRGQHITVQFVLGQVGDVITVAVIGTRGATPQ